MSFSYTINLVKPNVSPTACTEFIMHYSIVFTIHKVSALILLKCLVVAKGKRSDALDIQCHYNSQHTKGSVFQRRSGRLEKRRRVQL